ncbi:hypothetical protein GCM10027348_16620 [Hymenobacter tenuis]
MFETKEAIQSIRKNGMRRGVNGELEAAAGTGAVMGADMQGENGNSKSALTGAFNRRAFPVSLPRPD